MSNIWFTSDTHFNHSNILLFTDKETGLKIRPEFYDVNHMNECLISKWNEYVKPGDKIWHLGDVILGKQSDYNSIMMRLNGHKRLTLGNHDNIKNIHQYFYKVELWKIFKEKNMTFSHFPLREDQLRTYFNVHGHIHQNPDVSPRHINISVERTGYRPLHLDELVEICKNK